MSALDRVDRALLALLQNDASMSIADIGELVGLSTSPCARRIRRLENDGYITATVARVSREKLKLDIMVFVQVRLSQHKDAMVSNFEDSVSLMKEVVSCYTVSGGFDYLLQVVCRDLSNYEQWLKRLQKLDAVSQVDSSFSIRTVKEAGAYSID